MALCSRIESKNAGKRLKTEGGKMVNLYENNSQCRKIYVSSLAR